VRSEVGRDQAAFERTVGIIPPCAGGPLPSDERLAEMNPVQRCPEVRLEEVCWSVSSNPVSDQRIIKGRPFRYSFEG
jgi:hypothetical protein